MKLLFPFIAMLACVVFGDEARGQVFIPPVNQGLFEPEIGIINSGVILDAQATVSADRKYVTMTMRPSNTDLLALREFTFQNGGGAVGGGAVGGGFVGGVNPVVGGPGGSVIPTAPNAPMRVAPGNGGVILMTRGITPLVVPAN